MAMIVNDAKIMSKGQIMLPKDILETLKLKTGDSVTLICENNQMILMNSAVYAMKMLQDGMADETYRPDEDEVMDLVKEVRSEIEGL
ncbi:MAG TPA: AbrB family transcriptional regulator [Ruminococcus sp.]|nr:AbrB family transcriptional regulator [Ruminococcus sp.]